MTSRRSGSTSTSLLSVSRIFPAFEIRKEKLMLYLRLSPDAVQLESGFSRDVRNIGHWGTGDLELTIRDDKDLEKAKPLLIRSYGDS